MGKVEIGINNIGSVYLKTDKEILRIDDIRNDGVIECTLGNLRKTIRIIEDVYKNHKDFKHTFYGYGRDTIQLSYYQTSINKNVFRGNYIIISHMPAIIKMLKSVRVEKDKYILNKESLLGLGINDLAYLNKTMKRRRKVLTDNNGCKYIEV